MKTCKIVILDSYTANPGDLSWDALAELGELTMYDRTKPEECLERATDADILLTNKTVITPELMKACKNLKYIGVLATGYNVVDTVAAKELGIIVTNIPAYSTPSVAQMTFSLLLEICSNAGQHNQAVKAGEWENCADFCFWKKPLIELAGKTFGLVGYGRIGQAVAEIALAFGMNVIVSTRTPAKVTDPRVACVPLEDLYAKADVISLHCPLTDQNKEMINRESIAKMKDGVILINTGRGPLINEQDLADALQSGKVWGAGCDVVSVEPIQADNPLLKCENCIITPHIAWAPQESRFRLISIAAKNIAAFLKGQPMNVVNA